MARTRPHSEYRNTIPDSAEKSENTSSSEETIEVFDPVDFFINKLRKAVKEKQCLDRAGQQEAIINTVIKENEFLKTLSVDDLTRIKQAFIQHATEGGFLYFHTSKNPAVTASSSLGNFMGEVNQNKSDPLMNQLIKQILDLKVESPKKKS